MRGAVASHLFTGDPLVSDPTRPTAKAGMAMVTIIAAMTNPTVSNVMMRLIGIILSCRGRG